MRRAAKHKIRPPQQGAGWNTTGMLASLLAAGSLSATDTDQSLFMAAGCCGGMIISAITWQPSTRSTHTHTHVLIDNPDMQLTLTSTSYIATLTFDPVGTKP